MISRGIPDEAGTLSGWCGRAQDLEVLVHRDLHRVVVPVVAALDLHDVRAAGDRAHQVDGVHGGLGPRVAEPPQGEAEPLGQVLGHDDGVLGGLGEVGAPLDPRRWIAATTAGWAWPTAMTPYPLWRSTYSLPSASQTFEPTPAVDPDRLGPRDLPVGGHPAGQRALGPAVPARPTGPVATGRGPPARRSAHPAGRGPWPDRLGPGHHGGLPFFDWPFSTIARSPSGSARRGTFCTAVCSSAWGADLTNRRRVMGEQAHAPIDRLAAQRVLAPFGQSRTLPGRGVPLGRAPGLGGASLLRAVLGLPGADRGPVRATGELRAVEVGTEGLLLTRDRHGAVRGLLQRLPAPRARAAAVRRVRFGPGRSAARTTPGSTTSTGRSAPHRRSATWRGSTEPSIPLIEARVEEWHGWLFVNASGDARAARRARREPRRARRPLRAGAAAGRRPPRVRDRRELEGDRRELPRVLPLHFDPPRAVQGHARTRAGWTTCPTGRGRAATWS